MSLMSVTTRQQRSQKIRTAHRLPDPHLTHQVRLFPSRSPRRSSANAAPGGLEPPAVERFRRAYLHLSQSIASRSLDYMIRPLSTFVAHQGSGHGVIFRVSLGAGFDLVAQDEVGAGVTSSGGGEVFT